MNGGEKRDELLVKLDDLAAAKKPPGNLVPWPVAALLGLCLVCLTVLAALKVVPSEVAVSPISAALGAGLVQFLHQRNKKEDEHE